MVLVNSYLLNILVLTSNDVGLVSAFSSTASYEAGTQLYDLSIVPHVYPKLNMECTALARWHLQRLAPLSLRNKCPRQLAAR